VCLANTEITNLNCSQVEHYGRFLKLDRHLLRPFLRPAGAAEDARLSSVLHQERAALVFAWKGYCLSRQVWLSVNRHRKQIASAGAGLLALPT
jgi:hypothetical protein